MRYKIYTTYFEGDSIKVAKHTETDSPIVANLATEEARKILGSSLVVIAMIDGEVYSVQQGLHPKTS